jgi:predicted SAM-dependent methyltransferase
MGLRKIVNPLLVPLGLKLVSIPQELPVMPSFDLSLYPESSRPAQPKYVNIGALDFPHPLWHNLDNPTDWDGFSQRQQGNIHLPHDLTSGKPLPISSRTLAIVYCSHVIEHLRDGDVQLLFAEISRILQPGGTCRLVAPDMALFYDACRRGDEALFQSGLRLYECNTREQELMLQFASSLVLSHPATAHRKFTDEEIRSTLQSKSRDEFFEFFARQAPFEVQKQNPGDHRNWFTPEKTRLMLEAAGFSSIWQSAHGQSHLPVLRDLRHFDPYPDHSLYFECQK